MSEREDGGSAFPGLTLRKAYDSISTDPAITAPLYVEELTNGMSLRDYFAAAALQGLIASNDDEAGDRIADIPDYAYQIADAMLKERAK